MKCQRCEKEMEQTFYRAGGDYDLNGEYERNKAIRLGVSDVYQEKDEDR